MFSSFFRPWSRLSKRQRLAEIQAVELLTYAQDLLKKDDQNVSEALKLRFKVTHDILPKHRLYIARKSPRSLLLDVDRRIEHAYIRLTKEKGSDWWEQGEDMTEESTLPSLEEIMQVKADVYERVKNSEYERTQKTMHNIVMFMILSLLLLVLMRQILGPNELYNAVSWIPIR